MDIFVVDDERIIAETTAAILRQQGYSVAVFDDPHGVMKALLNGCPKLLIADFKIPGISGIELGTKVREACPDCRIIVFTGLTHVPDCPFHVLQKPASVSDLLETVRQHL